jgi:hypothetical protein
MARRWPHDQHLSPGQITRILLDEDDDNLSDPEIDEEDEGEEEPQGQTLELVFNADGELVAEFPRNITPFDTKT